MMTSKKMQNDLRQRAGNSGRVTDGLVRFSYLSFLGFAQMCTEHQIKHLAVIGIFEVEKFVQYDLCPLSVG